MVGGEREEERQGREKIEWEGRKKVRMKVRNWRSLGWRGKGGEQGRERKKGRGGRVGNGT